MCNVLFAKYLNSLFIASMLKERRKCSLTFKKIMGFPNHLNDSKYLKNLNAPCKVISDFQVFVTVTKHSHRIQRTVRYTEGYLFQVQTNS